MVYQRNEDLVHGISYHDSRREIAAPVNGLNGKQIEIKTEQLMAAACCTAVRLGARG